MNRYGRSEEEYYEYCPHCDANLSLQKGYSSDLTYWKCKGCGEMLINPAVSDDSNIVWICDKCGAYLNAQQGFGEDVTEWTCLECGHVNPIDALHVFASDDEYEHYASNPMSGLSDEAVLYLSEFEEIGIIGDRGDTKLLKHQGDGALYVCKTRSVYDCSVYELLMEHPISHMPKILAAFESDSALITIEEYIQGQTLETKLASGTIPFHQARDYSMQLCNILAEMHGMTPPLVHRDIKPANLIVSEGGELYLVDCNVAKKQQEDQIEDTKLLGTMYYAAPEQMGYGFAASTPKADIYALGILMNVMVTGKLPKEERAVEPLWEIIARCISLEAEKRPSATEVYNLLAHLEE